MNEDPGNVNQADEQLLRELLAGEQKRTSATHDTTVLAAARALTRERRRARWSHNWFGLAASVAAVAVAAIGITTLTHQSPTGDLDALRGDGAAVSPLNDVTLAAAPAELAWSPQAGASAYVVMLRDESAAVLWTSPPQQADRLLLPPEIVRLLSVPGTYLWTVEVHGAAARSLGPYWFHIAVAD